MMLLSHACGPTSINTFRDIDINTGAAVVPAVHCSGVLNVQHNYTLYCAAVQLSAVE